MTRTRRWPWILAAIVIGLPALGFVALRLLVNPETLRPRVVAAVQEATGRDFRVGEIALGISLSPTLVLRDVALANMQGGSRPEMLTAKRAELRVALLPLLSSRVEVERVALDAPDLLLETDAQGHGNWQFGPARPAGAAGAPTAGAPASTGGGSVPALGIAQIEMRDARVTWRDGTAGTAETLEIPSFAASAPLGGATAARAQLRLRGQQVAVELTSGALSALNGTEPWPVELKLTASGGTLRLTGTLSGGGAWTAEVEGKLPSLAAFAPLLPGVALPPLRDVEVAGKLAGTAGGVTSAEGLALRVGQSDLGTLRPGLVLGRLSLTAPQRDAPLMLAGDATLGGVPIRFGGAAGTPALLLGGTSDPAAVNLQVTAANATFSLQGQVGDPAAVTGVDLSLRAEVPDLSALTPLAGQPLPPLRDVTASARIAGRGARFADGVALRAIQVSSAPLAGQGELTLLLRPRPSLTGQLTLARADIDVLRASMSVAPSAPAAAPAAPAPQDGRVIPDTPLPVALLREADADLRLAATEIRAGGAAWRDLAAHLKLVGGKGGVESFTVQTPGGPLVGTLRGDATASPPQLRLTARAPALDMAALQRAFGQPLRVTGHGELDADLNGAGERLRAVAASLDGHLGLAMLDGTIEPALMRPAQEALRARIPVLPPLPERLPVECVALRADAKDGVVRIGTLLVDAPAAKVSGSGTITLADETLAMRLLHDIRAAGSNVRVAADLGGTLAAPAYRGVQAQNLGELVGGLAGRLGGDAGALLGALGGRSGAQPEPLPDCATALRAARGGREGRVPEARQEAPAQQQQQPQRQAPAQPQRSNPADLLRGLLGR